MGSLTDEAPLRQRYGGVCKSGVGYWSYVRLQAGRRLFVVASLTFIFLCVPPKSAFASTSEAINSLPVLDALNRTESPLSNGGKWSALNWATNSSGHATGQDATSGWGPYD